jgi:4'-phosphopantetheinyl transferase
MTSINFRSQEKIFSHSRLPETFPKRDEVFLAIGKNDVFGGISLPSEEQKRADSISSTETRLLFLAGRRLLRGVLSQWLHEDPVKIKIAVTKTGKPFLHEHKELSFSLSHSGAFVVAAFSPLEVGIDLELERPVDAKALAKRFFSPEEASAFESEEIASDKKQDHFFRLWTCREAAIKADGRGLSSLLSSTRVITEKEESLRVDIGETSWEAFPWQMSGGYHGAIALSRRPSLISWCDLR